MKNIGTISFLFFAMLLMGCVSKPDTEQLSQISGEQVQAFISGNSIEAKADYGKWQAFYSEEQSGVFLADGGSWSQEATFTYQISELGELCSIYQGAFDWTRPDFEYCTVFLTDAKGNYHIKNTKNHYRPQRVGQIHPMVIHSGDAFNLTQ